MSCTSVLHANGISSFNCSVPAGIVSNSLLACSSHVLGCCFCVSEKGWDCVGQKQKYELKSAFVCTNTVYRVSLSLGRLFVLCAPTGYKISHSPGRNNGHHIACFISPFLLIKVSCARFHNILIAVRRSDSQQLYFLFMRYNC